MSLWITYAWKDNEEGNFDYIIQELNSSGIDTQYDKIALVSGQRLWDQIADHISDSNTKGWAYLITENSLKSQPCLEELSYALDRVLRTKDGNFPLIGLLVPGIPFEDIPTALKVRLCISLGSTNWKEQIKAAIDLKPVALGQNAQTKYIYNVTSDFDGVDMVTTIEIRSRFAEVQLWRIVVPQHSNITKFGSGPAGKGQISGTQSNVINGVTGKLDGGIPVKIVGAGGPITSGTSAYIVIKGPRPAFLAFGNSNEAFGNPGELEIIKLD